MKDCIYIKNNKTYSLLELTQDYYKSKDSLKYGKVFSSDERVAAISGEILTLSRNNKDKFKEEKENIEKLTGKPIDSLSSKLHAKWFWLNDFTSKEQPELLSSVGLTQSRLNPEYNKNNRILNYVESKLDIPDSVPTTDLHPDFNLYFEKINFTDENKEKANYYLIEILNIIELEEKTNDFQIDFKNILKKYIDLKGKLDLDKNLKQLFEKHKDTILSDNEIGWIKAFKSEIINIFNTINNYAQEDSIMTDVHLISGNKAIAQVKDIVDIIAIDKSGNPLIFNIGLSQNNYDEWDSAKKLRSDWRLALQRQLLGQNVNIDTSSLNIIPLKFGKLTNGKLTPNNFKAESFKDRSIEQDGLMASGKLTVTAKRLIPEKIFITYNPERKKEVLSNLNILFNNFSIRTSTEENDVNKIIESVKSKLKGKEGWNFYNKFDDIEGLEKGSIKLNISKEDGSEKTNEELELEFREKIEQYVNRLKADESWEVSKLRSKLSNAINNPDITSLTGKTPKETTFINNTLKQFINDNYRILEDTEELVSLGIIILENVRNNKLSIISLSAYNHLAAVDYDQVKNYEELDWIKTFVVLNSFAKELKLDKRQIEYIEILNKDGFQRSAKNMNNMFSMYNDIMKSKKLQNNLNVSILSSIEDQAYNLIRNSFTSYTAEDKKGLEKVLANIEGKEFKDLSYEKLVEVKNAFLKEYPHLLDNTGNPKINFEDPKEVMYAVLQVALLSKNDNNLYGDFMHMRDWSISFPDVRSLFSALYTHKQEEYDDSGKRVLGLMGGLMLSTPDKIASNDLRNINIILTNTNNAFRQSLYKQSTIISDFTRKFFKEINFSTLDQNIWNNARNKFTRFYKIDSDGKILDNLQTLNPYVYDAENAMEEFERDYLKNMLFQIQKYRLDLTPEEIKKIDITSLDTIENTDKSGKVLKAIVSEEYFKIPLVRSEQLDRYGKVLEGGIKGIVQRTKTFFNEVYDFFDPREYGKNDLEVAKETMLGFHEMYDVYSRQTDANKIKNVQENGLIYYELNLDTIAHRVASSKIRKRQFDHKLPIIHSYMWAMKLKAGKNNTDISKEFKYVIKRLNDAAYNAPSTDEEFKDVITAASAIKSITTPAMLAFRIPLTLKEMTIGLFKGISLASTKMYGKDLFDLKSYSEAMKKFLTIDKRFSLEWNLLDGINNYYGFANMDVAFADRKFQTSRRGIIRGLNPYMYATSTIADYQNRLVLFVAKMIHDGSYEAHVLDEKGFLTYDPTKDARFSYYFENRDKYKDGDKYIPAKNDIKYNTQRNLYNLLIKQLNNEQIGSELIESDGIVNQAYSNLERNSFKSITDTAYGYYDKDFSSLVHNTVFGTIFLQFMQFWPGKMNLWFGKPIEADKSLMGNWVQKSIKIEGKDTLMWRESYIDPITGELEFRETTENTGDPFIEWKGSYQEGLAYAVMYTLQDALRMAKNGDVKGFVDVFKDGERMPRVYFALIDSILITALFAFLIKLISAWREEIGDDGVGQDLLKFSQVVSTKVLNEHNLYQNTFGAVHSEPAFISYATKAAGNVYDVLMGDKQFTKALSSNIRAFELLDPDL